MLATTPVDEHAETARLVESLATVAPPKDYELGDPEASRAAMRWCLDVANRADATITSHIRTEPLRPGEEPPTLPRSYVRVASILHALVDRALWLHHAWLCNLHGMKNDKLAFEPAVVVFAPD